MLLSDFVLSRTLERPTVIDWDTFFNESWEKKPAFYTNIPSFLPTEEELFHAVVECAERMDGFRLYQGHFEARRTGLLRPGMRPRIEDGTFSGYLDRLDHERGITNAGIICDSVTRELPDIWTQLQPLFGGLWDRVGLPVQHFHVDLFAGRYERTPFGAHLDPLSNFMMVIRGTRRMRLWDLDTRAKHNIPDTVYDYEEFNQHATTFDVVPGTLLYWPSSVLHVGESKGDTVSLNLDYFLPVRGRQNRFQAIRQLLERSRIDLERRGYREPNRSDRIHSEATRGEVTALPARYMLALETLREQISGLRGVEMVYSLWLSELSMLHLDRTPPLLSCESLDDTDQVEPNPGYRLVWMCMPGLILIGGAGRTFTIPNIDRARDFLEALCHDGPHRVGDLVERFIGIARFNSGKDVDIQPDEVRGIIRRLITFRVLIQTHKSM
jgi:hypothetical protein